MAFVELEYDTSFSRMARFGRNCLFFRGVLMIRDLVFGLTLSASGGNRGLGLGLRFSCEFGEDVFDLLMCVLSFYFPLFFLG